MSIRQITGPILLPDLSGDFDDLITRFELAFSAFNCPDWVEMIVRVPTPIEQGLQVYHYSRPVRFDVHNEVVYLTDAL